MQSLRTPGEPSPRAHLAAGSPQALEACGWRLRHLDISDCTGLTDASLRAVGERCGVLESFSLGMCPLLTTGAIQEVRARVWRGTVPALFCLAAVGRLSLAHPARCVVARHALLDFRPFAIPGCAVVGHCLVRVRTMNATPCLKRLGPWRPFQKEQDPGTRSRNKIHARTETETEADQRDLRGLQLRPPFFPSHRGCRRPVS